MNILSWLPSIIIWIFLFFYWWWLFEDQTINFTIREHPFRKVVRWFKNLEFPHLPHFGKRIRCWYFGHEGWYKMGDIKGCYYCGWSTSRYSKTDSML